MLAPFLALVPCPFAQVGRALGRRRKDEDGVLIPAGLSSGLHAWGRRHRTDGRAPPDSPEVDPKIRAPSRTEEDVGSVATHHTDASSRRRLGRHSRVGHGDAGQKGVRRRRGPVPCKSAPGAANSLRFCSGKVRMCLGPWREVRRDRSENWAGLGLWPLNDARRRRGSTPGVNSCCIRGCTCAAPVTLILCY